ncbi:MAG: SPOR domain-containing protein [Crocinitomicaceae bacterium]|nr:SPOR domain-containing protein [Crocinitomicaceae bacterium]MDP4722720.1 SPOR domain-containing protein [Crocinitomicaceae bacterium]MDP4738723.1 SPOR domain-containing protein [Crocinitomicaceae bacterium]MDP4798801.1 SPOR domain-containing protein [Crocinitomicaceae bacterium]MDP4806403.1 SPOR domain-containing protein [Crocinitomicaceae bacterium]
MQGFEDIIIQLLLRHNCVVVPGFGGFVAKQVAAEIDLDKGLIAPPKKALLFNRFLLTDDGLLLAEYARLHGLYYEEAKTQLQSHTDKLQRQLATGETLYLPKLGTFAKQPDGQISFEQDRFFNLLLSSYGLANLNFVAQPVQAAQETPIIELQPNSAPNKINWTRVAAAACILPFAFYSFWIPTQTNALQSGLFSSSDFNPLHQQDAPSYVKSSLELDLATEASKTQAPIGFQNGTRTSFETYEWQPGFNFVVKVPAAPVTLVAQETQPTPPQVNAPAAFDYIVGCFSNMQNAQNLVLKLKRDGFAARLIQNGPLTKVSAGAAQNLSELQQIQQQAAARGLQGWVLNN